jgi:hypothetical protein
MLKANDHVVVCSLESQDLWIKFKLHMQCTKKFLDSGIELKVDRNMTGADFHKLAQKLSLQIWNQHCQGKKNSQ